MKKSLSLADVYRLLEPGPVVLLTTALKGQTNVMPMSWHTMMEFEPPLVGCVVSNRNHSFGLLRASKECVINVPTVRLISETVHCGNCSGRTTDKFAAFGITPLPAQHVQAPLVGECPVNLECRVVDTRMVTPYNLFVLQVIKAWRDPRPKRLQTFHHLGLGRFMVAGATRVLPSRKK
ncbi:MAG: flavin reductase-like, FMN-binding [Burkholderiaceae bacterium]|jgi:flavin reductase (DIM6/NTAB) family NADH-FMN oxidoreductase RutF|nr:flavin reductase-like, FMN-binding [Burkholderiaceae bacterium]